MYAFSVQVSVPTTSPYVMVSSSKLVANELRIRPTAIRKLPTNDTDRELYRRRIGPAMIPKPLRLRYSLMR